MNLMLPSERLAPKKGKVHCQTIALFFFLSVLTSLTHWESALAQIVVATPPDSKAAAKRTGTVSGQFSVDKGRDMAGGNVMFHNAESGMPPKFSQYTRVPSLTTVINSDGTFRAELPVGKFFLFAIKKNSGKKFGKPRKGDYLFKLREENSLALTAIHIREGEHLDLGILKAVAKGDKKKPANPLSEHSAIEGTIRDAYGNPVNNGTVFAFPSSRMQGQRPLFVSEPTEGDGKYSLRVAGERTYFLMARDVLGGGKLGVGEIIGVYGGNIPVGIPVKTAETVAEKDIAVVTVQPRGPKEEFEAREKGSVRRENVVTGYLSGEVIMEDGSPLADAIVYLFSADKKQPADRKLSSGGQFRGEQNQVVGQLDGHGTFKLTVPAGKYTLAIIKRTSGEVLEPLREGDFYYLHRFSGGANTIVTINDGGETNLGRLVAHRYTAGGIADYPEYIGIASMTGTVRNSEGKPVAGASILIYREPGSLGPPLFSAGPSRDDGTFHVLFYEEGTYYLVAKLTDKGSPGIQLGRYGGEKGMPLVIKKNARIRGVDIVLHPVGPLME